MRASTQVMQTTTTFGAGSHTARISSMASGIFERWLPVTRSLSLMSR